MLSRRLARAINAPRPFRIACLRHASFTALNIPEHMQHRLGPLGYNAPTAIQIETIPLIMEPKTDIFVHDATGSAYLPSVLLPHHLPR
jgi:hypothetical protein